LIYDAIKTWQNFLTFFWWEISRTSLQHENALH
jgi:hypothetical protein